MIEDSDSSLKTLFPNSLTAPCSTENAFHKQVPHGQSLFWPAGLVHGLVNGPWPGSDVEV